MTRKERFLRVAAALEQLYPDARCSLFSGNAFELLVAVRLSAQCTDARVNQVTPALFAKYPTLEDYCNADVADIERLIYSCGFYRTKAENIIEMARKVRDDYDGRVPDTIEDLLTLPGVGRKTANLIVGDVYGKESVVVDTHMIRIANRLGLVATKDPKQIEFALKKIIPPDMGSDFCHRIVLFGRDICPARSPKCERCPLADGTCRRVGVAAKKRTIEDEKMQANSGNIILIGMPGSGKSTCGVVAAKLLLKNFFDTDLLIQNREGQRLQQIIDEKGLDYFARAEEEAVLSLDIAGTVIATGGSVVYSPAAMDHLRRMGKVIYLHLEYETMCRRIQNLDSRGVVLQAGYTLQDMYKERLPLYRRYADAVIKCDNNTVEQTAQQIARCAR